jgi:hypothetical protein
VCGYRWPMSRLLSESEIQALPEALREHYRASDALRSLDDLVWFPPAKREALERLAARGAQRTVERIRRTEGDTAAEAAAHAVEVARHTRATSQERRAS